MITIDDLPRDANGITQGAWRLVHADPTFAGGLGTVHMADGVSTSPVCGRQLRAIVAEYGGKLFLEPWGALPQHFALPELVSATVSDEQLAKLPRAPWRDVAAEACMPLTLELIRLGGEGAPTDFAAAMAEEIPNEQARSVRAFFAEKAQALSADGYVEIPKALAGKIATLDAQIAALPNEPETSEPSETTGASSESAQGDDSPPSTPPAPEPTQAATSDDLPPVLAPADEPEQADAVTEPPAEPAEPPTEPTATPAPTKPKGRRLPRS